MCAYCVITLQTPLSVTIYVNDLPLPLHDEIQVSDQK